ncbi:MAG: methionyl-tRNA formyltransferase [Anaerolineales bacterium]|nr:methionyl-tRNA formyltransferase [Anaerolineales bacterium]
MSPSIVFMGTPDFAVPVLEKLSNNFQVTGVITQPDRPSGRGRKLIPSAVKVSAGSLNLEIFQTGNVNSNSTQEIIQTWNPDLIVVAAFGQILSPSLLAIPKFGCLNVHASLLPRWRGASPINAAILNGDLNSGVTIMRMAEGLDDGPILVQETTLIQPEETAGSLSDRLSSMGANLLVKTIPHYLSGEIQPTAQDHSKSTYAHMLKRQDGLLDFHQKAGALARKVRAYSPWPGTYTFWNDQRMIIHQVQAISVTSPGPGVFTRYESFPAIGTGDGILVLKNLQLAGKRKLTGKEFLHGTSRWPNSH